MTVRRPPTAIASVVLVGLAWAGAGRPRTIPRPVDLAAPRSLDQVGLPRDATRALIPADNPQTPAKVALGERLFFERRLSADGTVACSTCHDPARAFTDGLPASIGVKGGNSGRAVCDVTLIDVSSKAPMRAPCTDPIPPDRLTPPMTAEAIASSSRKLPVEGTTASSRAAAIMPASP